MVLNVAGVLVSISAIFYWHFQTQPISGVHIDRPQKEKIANEQLWCGRSGVTGAEMAADLNLRSAEEL